MTVLASVDDWFTLGLFLGVKYHTLLIIRADNINDTEYKQHILVTWLNSEDTSTKYQLLTALWYICTHPM